MVGICIWNIVIISLKIQLLDSKWYRGMTIIPCHLYSVENLVDTDSCKMQPFISRFFELIVKMIFLVEYKRVSSKRQAVSSSATKLFIKKFSSIFWVFIKCDNRSGAFFILFQTESYWLFSFLKNWRHPIMECFVKPDVLKEN